MSASRRALALAAFTVLYQHARAGEVSPSVAASYFADIDSVWLYAFELMLVGLSAIFAANYVVGLRYNQALADAAVATLNPALVSQFARLGVDKDNTPLLKDGPSNFFYYATGRQFTTGLTVSMEMADRMDLFYRVANLWEASRGDQCSFLLPLTDDFAMEPISLFISRRKELERLRVAGDVTARRVKSIESLAGEVMQPAFMGDEFVILADHADVITAMLPGHIRDILASVAPSLLSIHVTDTGAPWDYQALNTTRVVHLVFKLPGSADGNAMSSVLKPMTTLAMHFVDACAKVKLSPAARTRGTELRRAAKADEEKRRMKQRREDAEQRKVEKRLAEEEKVSKLSAAQQAKYDEKSRKRELAKRMRKVKG
jgi:Protein of unknown function (DUF1682)